MSWSVDFACLVVRLRQIKATDDDFGDFLLDRVLNCDLPRMEQYLTGEQWEMIRKAEEDVMGGNAQVRASGTNVDRSAGRDKG